MMISIENEGARFMLYLHENKFDRSSALYPVS